MTIKEEMSMQLNTVPLAFTRVRNTAIFSLKNLFWSYYRGTTLDQHAERIYFSEASFKSQRHTSITFEVKLPSACSFIVDGLVLYCIVDILHTWRWPCRPKHVLWTSTTKRKTIYNKAARRRQLNLKSYWTIRCSRMLKYNIMSHTSNSNYMLE
jgi:hypothetical protein